MWVCSGYVTRGVVVAFVQAASEGKYYKPMDAVGRMAKIAAASEALGKDEILSVLVQEVRELKGSVREAVTAPKPDIEWDSTLPLKTIWNQRKLRKNLFAFFESMGGTAKTWNSVLKHRVSVEFARETATWTEQRWKEYIVSDFEPKPKSNAMPIDRVPIPTQIAAPVDDELIEKVRSCLPEQPWPKDTHKVVIARLGISGSQYTRAVNALIKRGVFKRQVLALSGSGLKVHYQAMNLSCQRTALGLYRQLQGSNWMSAPAANQSIAP